MEYLQNQDLGFNKEQVIILRKARGLGNNYYPFIEKLKQLTGVESVSATQTLPGDDYDSTIFVPEQPSNYEQTSLTYSHVDADFVDVLKLKIVEGRNFNLQITTDSTAYLLNQATSLNIVQLLSKDFLKLVCFALLIATPIAWYLMNQWLHDFAYRINIQWWYFVVAGGAALIIAFLTVSLQSLKIALANPVKALKRE